MLERYKPQLLKYVEIPSVKGTVLIETNENCQVLMINKKDVVLKVNEKGEYFAEADLWYGKMWYPLAFLMLLISGKLKVPKEMFHLVEYFFIDGDPRNLHIANIGYRFIGPIESKEKPGFYHIPFFSRYLISKDQKLFDCHRSKFMGFWVYKIKPDKNRRNIKGGYRKVLLESDVGAIKIGRHRLMGLTFLHYPNNVDDLVINHIDGIPGNDWIENLEWVTRLQNNIHAVENGLRHQAVRCYVKNIFTGQELTFASLSRAAVHFKLSPATIMQRVNSEGKRVYSGGWLFKTDKDIPWGTFKDPIKDLKQQSTPTNVRSRNVFTGEIREHKSIAQCGVDLGFADPQAVKHQILKGIKRPYFGYNFRTEYDTTPWQEYSERELAVFKDNPKSNGRGVIATDNNGNELFFTSIVKASEHFKHILKSKNDVIKAIARNRNVNGFKLSYL